MFSTDPPVFKVNSFDEQTGEGMWQRVGGTLEIRNLPTKSLSADFKGS
jgi:hypothetical protein